ncbi:MAG: (Fe-S)-binding protein [Bdellovibrionales bacterium]|nr:(Fe-S)-binding protein [Bdellovibrionales bacterium]
MTWQTFAFLIIAGFAFTYSGLKFKMLFELMRKHQGKGPALDRIPERIKTAIANVFGQAAVNRKQPIGILHTTIFWGFLVITIGTLEQFVSTIYSGANFEFIGHGPYSVLVRVQDFFTAAILVAVCGAFYRRLVVQPAGIGVSRDANIVLTFTGALMIAILFMNAFYILAHHPFYSESMPVSLALATFLRGYRYSPETNAVLFTAWKWVHMLLVLGFAMYIPSSKHLHLVAAGPNSFLRKLDREKPMKPIDFTNESITQYGAAKITDLSWKDTLDYYSCTECGRCQDLCPAWNTGKELSPKKLVMDLKTNMYRNKSAILAGKYEEVGPIIDENVTEGVIWACTSCRACEVACPVFIQQVDKIYETRRNLVMMESKFPAEVQTVFKNMETNYSPWAFSAADRGNWADGLEVKTMADVGKADDLDVLLWVGCAGSFDDRNKKVLRSFVSLLKKADVKFAILGSEEQCTGDAARRIGNEYLFQTLATANVETLNRYAVKKVVTACPHCFNILKNEYKDFGGNYEVVHHSQFLSQMIRDGKLKPAAALNAKVTFHDSCYLGRWNNVYEQPRAVLGAVPGIELLEMKQNHDQSMCCGAGGGRMWMEETVGKRVNITRTEQALETGASVIAAACPFCMTMMSDGVKAKEKTESVKVMDLAELLDQATT